MNLLDVNNFDAMRIGLASPEQIRAWSFGEVKKPETINYRTLKPERDGLFCEKIFGPTKDWECHCGKYKRIRFKGMICDRCGVEITRAKVRRERMGHIELATPVSHIWYFKGVPSRIGILLDMSPRQLEKVIYFAAYIVIEPGSTSLTKREVLTEQKYRESREKYGNGFKAGMGAEAIRDLLKDLNLRKLQEELRREFKETTGQKRVKAIKRLEVVEAFLASGNKPEWMILSAVPVIAPELRPMVQLDGGRFATSDLNDLYRRVINRNNRLKRLLELSAPEIIIKNEKRMLQEAVDALIDNGRRGRPVTGPNNRPLKSLSDILKGKQGRFRQNLLGKRVDYSGRSVIVVGPNLKLHQCGLPKEMALELFKPFVMKKLVDRQQAHNIKSAKRMVERVRPEVWDVLDEVIREHPVLLNRAPTLHRLGIQAFEPVLVEGKAIHLHPLVCTPYNADFDGDQMAVHLPLSAGAQAEARILMLSSNNILAPSFGNPVSIPTQDMVLGLYYLTFNRDEYKGPARAAVVDDYASYPPPETLRRRDLWERRNAASETPVPALKEAPLPEGVERLPYFGDINTARLAWDHKQIGLQQWIYLRFRGQRIKTTVGRAFFNDAIPEKWNHAYVNHTMDKGALKRLITDCYRKYGNAATAGFLDAIKTLGFRFATQSGTTVSISDVVVPQAKYDLLDTAQANVDDLHKLFDQGFISEEERYTKTIAIWQKCAEDVTVAMQQAQNPLNPVFMMATSGARGSINQVKQLGGMRGLMSDPSGRILEIPVKASLKEGLTVLEYFISTHGARKGLADTALRTADSGYLTRRLVDVAQDVIIREEDCGTTNGITVSEIRVGKETIEPLTDRILGRRALVDIKDPEKPRTKLVARDEEIDEEKAKALIAAGITEVKIRSVLACQARYGVCSMCYGRNLATGKSVDIGEAVGIIAAQSIGEPGTQLTLRTFHTGGVATADIITGLPRVEEIFEARKPKGVARVVEEDGTIKILEDSKTKKILHVIDDTGEEHEYELPLNTHLTVQDGQRITKGDQLHDGSLDPHDILRIKGETALQNYLVQEVQKVYRSQGVDINDKHIETIVRSMLRKVKLVDGGDTRMLPGQLIEQSTFREENEKIAAEGGKKAEGIPVLLGVTKASLATDSFLSAASFQETTRVLTDAAIKGKHDPLLGLKENVIIGKLIPAGTGMSRYRNLTIEPEGQDLDEEGRPKNNFLLDADYLAEEYNAVVGPGGQEMSSKLMGPYERQRLQENSVTYEGDYETDVAVAAPAQKTQYKPKGINPEDL